MLVKRNGIYKTINPIEYGIYLEAGFVKVADDVKTEEKVEIVQEQAEPEIKEDLIVEEEIKPEIEEEVEEQKPKKRGRNK